jgi:O-antigen ligase
VTEVSSLHNAWLEILLDVGVLGFLPFLCTFLGMWRQLLWPLSAADARSLPGEIRLEAMGLFVLMCFRSVFSVEFTWHPPLMFFLVLAFAELLRRSRQAGAWARHGIAPGLSSPAARAVALPRSNARPRR